jgi:hypothetical protein
MTDEQSNDQVPDPQGYLWGLPYDWRRPTRARFRARWWNRNDPRLFTPRAFGAGWDINLYWVSHPGQFVQARRGD